MKDGQSGLPTRIAATERVSLCGADEKLTAFLELELATQNSSASAIFS